jgi:hypothetical protein
MHPKVARNKFVEQDLLKHRATLLERSTSKKRQYQKKFIIYDLSKFDDISTLTYDAYFG